ncbi:hypothetical protein Tco_0175112 [Tanacetum coccineum]
MKGDGVSFLNFLLIRYGSCQVEDSVWSKRKDLFRLWVIDKSSEVLDPDEDPFGRCLDEYNRVFPKEIEQLADEHEIKIREKGQVLEEIWIKCKKARSKDNDWCGKSNETLSLGRKNGSRFRKMIMEEMEETLKDDGEDSVDEMYHEHEIQKLRGNSRDRLDSYSFGDKELAGRRR